MLNKQISLYKKMYLIRQVEYAIQREYYNNEMKTPMHMSLGEEGIVSGICHALSKEDQVLGTHRSHALYLAKTEETDNFFKELYGKKNYICNGIAGSMHLSNIEYGFIASSAIVGGNIAMSVGAAFANKYKKNSKIVVAFFGDGATEEGTFWESVNLACLWQLPIIFVCEDNELAVNTLKEDRHGYKCIGEIIKKFNCKVFQSETTNVNEIYKIAKKSINRIKKYAGPIFIHLKYYRYLEHVGVNSDLDCSYRNINDYNLWKEKDPLDIQKNILLQSGIDIEKIDDIENVIRRKIEKSMSEARNEKFSDSSEIYKNVFYEKK